MSVSRCEICAIVNMCLCTFCEATEVCLGSLGFFFPPTSHVEEPAYTVQLSEITATSFQLTFVRKSDAFWFSLYQSYLRLSSCGAKQMACHGKGKELHRLPEVYKNGSLKGKSTDFQLPGKTTAYMKKSCVMSFVAPEEAVRNLIN